MQGLASGNLQHSSLHGAVLKARAHKYSRSAHVAHVGVVASSDGEHIDKILHILHFEYPSSHLTLSHPLCSSIDGQSSTRRSD